MGVDPISRIQSRLGGAPQFHMGDDCENVPPGYAPLSNIEIEFLDAAGNVVGSTTTNSCGEIDTSVPPSAVMISAVADGYRPISANITAFQLGENTIGSVSTISDKAEYKIAALQLIDDTRLAFTVTDTVTNQAVLGLPASAFNVTLDSAESEIESVSIALSEDDSASTILVMDASGSMDEDVYTEPVTGKVFNRYQVARVAAHTFLGQKSLNDEGAIAIFSVRQFFIDQAAINSEFALTDGDGNAVLLPYPEDGFTTDERRLRFTVDAYNPESSLYRGGEDAPHPDTPANIQISSSYPFAGDTALYDAIVQNIARLDSREALRPIIIAMTDGQDNSSAVRSFELVIDDAVAANIPVYTVGFGGDTAETELTEIATRTGGSFFSAESLDLATTFQNIQTGIVFQYICNLTNGGIESAFTLGVSLSHNGLSADRGISLRN